jgi:activator of HSP90 ATPase
MGKSSRNDPAPVDAVTRRRAIVGIAIALGGAVFGTRARGQTQQQPVTPTPGAAQEPERTTLHYEADFNATPQRIYEVLLDSNQFAAFTGMPAVIDPREGAPFSLFGGLIGGRNVEFVPYKRIVQAWRPAHWAAGIYSIVKFEFREEGLQTRLLLDHTGFPEGESVSLDHGWKSHYLVPLAKYLS